jgi:hypothetical protein
LKRLNTGHWRKHGQVLKRASCCFGRCRDFALNPKRTIKTIALDFPAFPVDTNKFAQVKRRGVEMEEEEVDQALLPVVVPLIKEVS